MTKEKDRMKSVPNAFVEESRLDICFVVGMIIRYQSNLGMRHWTTVKHILKYLQRTILYVGVSLG